MRSTSLARPGKTTVYISTILSEISSGLYVDASDEENLNSNGICILALQKSFFEARFNKNMVS